MLPSNHRIYGNDPFITLPEYALCGIMQAFTTFDEDLD
jgi:hypothetical protein